MRTSDAGLGFIAAFESFKPAMYNDVAGHCTIGYGHLIHHGPINGTEPPMFRRGITLQEGLELMRSDAAAAEVAVVRLIKPQLNQKQFDALVSFAFNCGAGALEQSTARRLINAGNLVDGAWALNLFVRAGNIPRVPGLVRRRKAEQLLFDGADYGVAKLDFAGLAGIDRANLLGQRQPHH